MPFRTLLQNTSSPSVPAAIPISIGALVSVSFALAAECVVTLSVMMFSSARSCSSHDQCGATESIVQQTRGHQPLHCQSLLFVSNFPRPSFVLVRLMDAVTEGVVELLLALACSRVLTSIAELALRILLRLRYCLLLRLTLHHVLFQHHSILSLRIALIFSLPLLQFCTLLPASQACRKRLDHSLSLPAENRTRFIKASIRVHCVHTIVHVQLDHRPISSVSNVRILFIQHNSVPSLDDFLH